jgi:hypothetical protein
VTVSKKSKAMELNFLIYLYSVFGWKQREGGGGCLIDIVWMFLKRGDGV